MASVGPTPFILLIIIVAVGAASGGFIAATVLHGDKRHLRKLFLLGFGAGWLTGTVLRGRRRGLAVLTTVVKRVEHHFGRNQLVSVTTRFIIPLALRCASRHEQVSIPFRRGIVAAWQRK